MISIDDVKHIAKLAKLRFTDEEAERMAKDFEGILEHFKSIDKFDLSAVDLNKYEDGLKSVIREDEVRVYENKEKLFKNAKTMRETYIEVPKIIE
ncbi:Asp-tRNA(Asn)/Glu-tRNA(Gln) amidotransferase subunit GatC [Clostridium magnum]|uniref:Aspartyl/glutamyl-tRNA(Asn/Gln) amidotransferase subunit C n=1 Tax=Clostridium magnum DSM 2767 TaxID=1121326 RepID=A0A162R6G3_9CLOT|nr:Asp-tRNA(Asn)/Glu-tRNA(Gln) amidotransferase subunit GatC [Clostridium magnum]KZL89501.1 aspartyl/glutamyl-tRNA(Asn/Gln) amidotransferase subunit C [Clostridium magnum DSM 2767]SHH70671.1 aspartyl/glutamyl-tRNA(Asn/Gln) amidotransferase subunit C [Clostridium magnum DSM 2767]